MIPACGVLLSARTLLEVAAEFDPDTYVPVLDLLDADEEDLEDNDREPNCDEDESFGEVLWIREYCPCCGHLTQGTPEEIL